MEGEENHLGGYYGRMTKMWQAQLNDVGSKFFNFKPWLLGRGRDLTTLADRPSKSAKLAAVKLTVPLGAVNQSRYLLYYRVSAAMLPIAVERAIVPVFFWQVAALAPAITRRVISI
jgi:hypothetical protein